MRLEVVTDNGHRVQLWPIQLRWRRGGASQWLSRHFWQTGTDDSTGDGCMPGKRRTYGMTVHLGALKVCFGERTVTS